MFSKNGTQKDNLCAISKTIGQTFTAPVLSNLYRQAIAGATRFPEMGEILTAKILQKHIHAGELAIDDVPLAAHQYQEWFKAGFFHVAVFGIRTDFTQAHFDPSAANADQTFLREYRVR